MLGSKAYLHKLEDISKVTAKFVTPDNPLGMGDLQTGAHGDIVVLPSEKKNAIQVWKNEETLNITYEAYDEGIGFLQISPNASLLAKACGQGKYIRIFKLDEELTEVRRFY